MRVGESGSHSRFVQDLARRGDLFVDRMSSGTARALQSAGISRADLDRIAGDDRVIRGDEFGALFSLLEGRGTDRAGRTGDLGRAQQVYETLRAEVDGGRRGDEVAAGDTGRTGGTRSYGVGLRDEMTGRVDRRSSASGRPAVEYAPNELPNVRPDGELPEEPNWFIAFLECLFQWIPGVTTHEQRLEAFGRELADEHGSDIQAFQQAYEAERATGPRDAMGRTGGDFRGALVRHLADRFEQSARARGQSFSREDAVRSAETVVRATIARLEEIGEAAADRSGELPGVTDASTRSAQQLAVDYFPAQETADDLGGEWGARLDRAMTAPPASHPYVQLNPDHAEQVSNVVRSQNVESVAYLMALERSGQLEHVPGDAIDGLLAAQHAGLIDGAAVRETVNALQGMPADQRSATLDAIRGVPEDRRGAAWATLGREHFALRSSSAEVRAGARARVALAAEQLEGLDAASASEALDRGTLGLIEDHARVEHRVRGRTVSTDVPVYFHPGIPEDRRDDYRAMVSEAYGMMPQPALAAMMAGEDGRGFNVQIAPEASVESGLAYQRRPSAESPLGGFFRTQDNMVRLNADELDRRVATSPTGRQDAVGYILHESSHYLDDLGDTAQERGFFVDTDARRSRERISGDGDLAPAYAHFQASRQRFEDIRDRIDNPSIRRWYTLGRRGADRTEQEDQLYDRMTRHYAALAGAVSGYGAEGGDEAVRSPGVNLAEWWAETSAHFLHPERRERLRSIDPVAHQAAARYFGLIEQGTPPEDAMREALRFSLSVHVSAEQGQHMLEAAGDDPLSDQTLEDLDAIAGAVEQHAEALDGWEPYRGNAGLRTMRRTEAEGGVREGRALLGRIDERLGQLDQSGTEHQRLSRIRARLDRALTRLADNAAALRQSSEERD